MLLAADTASISRAASRGGRGGPEAGSAGMVCSIQQTSKPPLGFGCRGFRLTETRLVIVNGRRGIAGASTPNVTPHSSTRDTPARVSTSGSVSSTPEAWSLTTPRTDQGLPPGTPGDDVACACPTVVSSTGGGTAQTRSCPWARARPAAALSRTQSDALTAAIRSSRTSALVLGLPSTSFVGEVPADEGLDSACAPYAECEKLERFDQVMP
jgi:hypothetical protein